MQNLYSFSWSVRRMGDISGWFIATQEQVEKAIGMRVHFGEALGKHSEIYGVLKSKDITLLSDDQDLIAKLVQINKEKLLASDYNLYTLTGYNPLKYLRDENGEEYELS